MPAVNKNRNQIAIVSVALFSVALFLTAYSARNPWTTTIGAEATSILLRPFQSLHYGLGHALSSVWSEYFALVGVRSDNQMLQQRLRELESQNSSLLEMESENARLRELMSFKQEAALKGIVARVIGFDPSNWSKIVTIDSGRLRGVERGQAVVAGNGVVGQVISVGQLSSRVLLIIDHTSGIDAIVQGGRARGVIEGSGEGCQLNFVPIEEEVRVGDRVITSGMDGVYPKGLLVGVVANVEKKGQGMFQKIAVTPAVNFRKIEEVLVAQNVLDRAALVADEVKGAKNQ